MNLFNNINSIKQNITDNIIVMFSTGKDATVMLDLLVKHIGCERLSVIYMYFIRDLSFKNKIISYYQNKYNIKIDQYPHYELSKILKKRIGYKNKNISFSQFQDFLRNKYNTSWIAYGYRINESIERTQMIRSEAPNGIDYRNKKLYPVANFNEKTIKQYLLINKLPITIEYSYGFRDINMPYGEIINWLKINYPDDFNLAIKQYPFLQGDLLRWQMNQN